MRAAVTSIPRRLRFRDRRAGDRGHMQCVVALFEFREKLTPKERQESGPPIVKAAAASTTEPGRFAILPRSARIHRTKGGGLSTSSFGDRPTAKEHHTKSWRNSQRKRDLSEPYFGRPLHIRVPKIARPSRRDANPPIPSSKDGEIGGNSPSFAVANSLCRLTLE